MPRSVGMIGLLIACCLPGKLLQAQELNCDVTINAQKVTTADPTMFKTLETSVREFMNSRKWTNDVFQPSEKIDCRISITIIEEQPGDKFTAQVLLQSYRPVYNSGYQTVLFNHADEWEFTYQQYQPLDFDEGAHLSNLTSFLAFYANIMIGLDYDAFGKESGNPSFLKAQAIVNNAQNSTEKGWRAFDGPRNRYWLIENLLNKKYSAFRFAFYQYHLNALDKMYENRGQATRLINNSLSILDKLYKDYPTTMIFQLFFNAKSEELLQIFRAAAPTEKVKAVNILSKLDPGNSDKYQALLKG